MVSAVKTIRTSVRSEAGCPSSGWFCTKPVAGAASAQAGSSSTAPSSTGAMAAAMAVSDRVPPIDATWNPAVVGADSAED